MSWLGIDLPGNGTGNPSCYLLSMCWFSLEEERVMQQSSVSISLSFENQGINLVGGFSKVRRTYTNKNTYGKKAKKRQIFSKIILEVGERKTRGKWRIMQYKREEFMVGTWYGLTWRRSPRQRCQKSFLLPLELVLVFPWRGKGNAAK